MGMSIYDIQHVRYKMKQFNGFVFQFLLDRYPTRKGGTPFVFSLYLVR
jgi:hypothetical protein